MAYSNFAGEPGKRGRWLISASPESLKVACDERVAFHQGRITFWEGESIKAIAELKEKGLSFTHYDVSNGMRTDVTADPKLARRAQECEQGVKRHKDSMARFVAFRSLFLLAVPGVALELNVDDVFYFNLSGADAIGDETID